MDSLAHKMTSAMTCLSACSPSHHISEDDFNEAYARDKEISKLLKQWKREENKVVHILLLGTGESGKSTITKQMKIIHINGFSDSERQEKIPAIRKNLRDAILSICGAMNNLNIPICDEDVRQSADYLLTEATSDNFNYPQEFYDHVQLCWTDTSVRDTYKRSHEYQLIDCAKYFLDRVDIIRREDYIPSDQDILRCRVMTNSIQRIDYSVQDGKTQVNFSVYDVGGQRGERRRWLQIFDTTTAILFMLDCSSFDLTLREDTTKNRLLEAAEIFEQVWNSRWLQGISVILFINKIDVLNEKVNDNGITFQTFCDNIEPDNKYKQFFSGFAEFNKIKETERREFVDAFPVVDADGSAGSTRFSVKHSLAGLRPRARSRSASIRREVTDEVIRTAVFIKNVFMQIAHTPRQDEYGRNWHSQHSCSYYYTCAVDTDNIRKVLEGCRTVIIRRHLSRIGV